MGLFDGLRKKKMDDLARQVQESLRKLCSLSVDYELLETEDGSNFFLITDDTNLPHGSGSKYDSIVQSAQGRAGYHSFIGVHELSNRKANPKEFGFLICPFVIRNNPSFSGILKHLIQKSDNGKKDVFVKIIGRSSYNKALLDGHTAAELFNNTHGLAGNNWTGVGSKFEIISRAYNEVIELQVMKKEYASSLCPHCRNEASNNN